MALANKHQIFVIEDVAQALGSEYNGEKLGTFGTIGCTSFFPTKNLACFGDGGAVFTRDQSLANKIKMLANHGQQKKYDHQYVGVNSRLDTLQAAILCHQLTQLEVNIDRKIALAQHYNEGLKSLNIDIPVKREYTKHSFNQYCIVLESASQRDQLKAYLAYHDIATMIYYSQPNHLQQALWGKLAGKAHCVLAPAHIGKAAGGIGGGAHEVAQGAEIVSLGFNTPSENLHYPEPPALRVHHHLTIPIR